MYPPILREEILNLKPIKGDHILVYQTSTSNSNLFQILNDINEKFIVYGFDTDKVEKILHIVSSTKISFSVTLVLVKQY